MPKNGEDDLGYAYDEAAAVHVEKRFSFVPGTYQMNVQITVENRGDKPIAEHLLVDMFGHQDPSVKAGGMFLGPRVVRTSGHVQRERQAAPRRSAVAAQGAAR